MATAIAERPMRADPLKVLSLAEVVRRTGYGRRKIFKSLADDRRDGSPGLRFPVPMKAAATGRLEWRELSLLNWMEEREQAERKAMAS